MFFPSYTTSTGRPLDQVQLTGMLMSCVIGIFPHERHRKQPVTVDLCLYLDTRIAASTTSIHDTIDYAGAVKEVSYILDHSEFQLIETAVEAVCQHFLQVYRPHHGLPAIEAVAVRISKPSALTHGIVPSVQIMRTRDDILSREDSPSISGLSRIYHSQDSTLYMYISRDLSPFQIPSIVANAVSVFTLGRWMFNGQPIKNRSTVILSEQNENLFQGQSESSGHNILLIQSRP